jgi:hypothetical protein
MKSSIKKLENKGIKNIKTVKGGNLHPTQLFAHNIMQRETNNT